MNNDTAINEVSDDFDDVIEVKMDVDEKDTTFEIPYKEYDDFEDNQDYTEGNLTLCDADVNEGADIPLTNMNSDNSTHYGYWVFSSSMQELNLTDLSNHGVTDIFLNGKAYGRFNKTYIEDWIFNASEKGINTHIWVQIFYKSSWIRPISNDGLFNYDFFDEKIDEIKRIANTTGIYGIHYDYLRFSGSEKYNNSGYQNPGGKEAIVYFVNESVKAIHDINPNVVTSAAIMPEPERLERIYGVDYPRISEILDLILPMIYTGNYNQDTEWIKDTTEWFIDNSKGAEIWTGLQGYSFADYDEEVISNTPTSQMNIDIQAALDAQAPGVIVFRYGVCNNLDFNNLSVDEEELESFSYLNYLVSNAKVPIKLTNDISFNEKYDESFIKGIKVLKNNLVIDGDNHIVDANGMARIFNISGNNITLMNFNFVNAFSDRGAALYITGNDAKIINCTFLNGIASTEAGAIFLSASSGQIINSSFINNTASVSGGAIYLKGNGDVIYNSTFANNTAEFGQAISALNDLDVLKCSLVNNDIFAKDCAVNVISSPEDIQIVAKTATYTINYGGKYSITLKDFNGNLIKGKNVTFKLAGKNIGSSTTDSKGIAAIKLSAKMLKTAKAGKKNLIIKFIEDNYAPANKTVKVTVSKEKTKLTAKAKSFKRTVKTKKYTITLKNSKNNVMKNAKVTLKVNGKTYKATTNSKGKATFKITKLTKKGTFKAVVKYSGNAYYKSTSKTVNLTVKK